MGAALPVLPGCDVGLGGFTLGLAALLARGWPARRPCVATGTVPGAPTAFHPALDAAFAIDSRGAVLQLARALRRIQPLGPDLGCFTAVRLVEQAPGHGRLRRLLHLDIQVEQQPDGLLLDAFHHRGEQIVALALVLHQRLLLRERPQPDALTQVVHLIQMLTPLPVQHGQHHAPFELARGLGTERLLARGVGRLRVVHQDLGQGLGVDVAAPTDLVFNLVNGDTHRVQRLELGPELIEIPITAVLAGSDTLHIRSDGIFDHAVNLVGQILTFQDAATFAVDHAALAVHDVVVLENVLAHLEVLRLTLRLGALHGATDPLVFDGDVIGLVQAAQDHVDPVALEQPHQVITQGQVEPRLPRVTLTSRPAAQLIVDASRLVTLSAQDIETARLADFLTFGGDLRLQLCQYIALGGTVLLGALHRIEPALFEFGLGHELVVTTQHDVGTAAGHVGGHGDGTLTTGLRHDRGFPVVLFGVQDLVRHSALTQLLGKTLGLLHTGRPHENGLPFLVTLDQVVDDGVELRILGAEDQVILVDTGQWPVRGNRYHTEAVDLVELS